MQRWSKPADKVGFTGFSIHKRIVGGATGVVSGAVSGLRRFQYPQADRGGCNPRLGALVGWHISVSVSTSGSWGVQLDRIERTIRRINRVSVSTSGSWGVQQFTYDISGVELRCFSIHKRIVGGATVTDYELDSAGHCFSIHKRIVGGATMFRVLNVIGVYSFQYPQADRGGCNLDENGYPDEAENVSVSTSGSWGVQPSVNLLNSSFGNCFSIHKRIVGGATSPICPLSARYASVSVSTSGSWGVQLMKEVEIESEFFSFSIHKRIVGGATLQRLDVSDHFNRFSIHKRIVGGATGQSISRVLYQSVFQYPQADRGGCNTGFCLNGKSTATVSVSTSGSWGVQLISLTAVIVHRASFSIHKRIVGGATVNEVRAYQLEEKVSVSTSGSWGVQRPDQPAGQPIQPAFQYPQADRGGCNGAVYRNSVQN